MNDVALLKRAGKVVFVTYQGTDARQVDYCKANFAIHNFTDIDQESLGPEAFLDRAALDDWKRWRISYFDKYADRIFALNPDLLHVLPPRAQFLPYASVDPREWMPCENITSDGPLRIIHAPSGRISKGTKYLLEAVKTLQDEGLDFEFHLIENIPHHEVKNIYRSADLVVDQLLIGWYGALAVELMALGKPVIAYIRDEDLRFIPPAMKEELPLVNANPHTIYDVLKRCLSMERSDLRAIGARSRAFVERWHDPLKIAAQLKEEAEQILLEKRGNRLAKRVRP
jgi:glycosyltransferase involved in cell wall biosynthesis